MRTKLAVALVGMLAGAGCSHSGLVTKPVPAPDQAHEVDDRYAYMGCDAAYVRANFPAWQLEVADRVYLYALMSSNAYADEGQYAIPGWTRVARHESTSGLGLDEWVRDGSSPRETVLAFRGTQFTSLKDWKTNLAFIEPWQHREAYDHIAKLRAEQPDTRLTVTGHSLGGALSLNMSHRFDNLPAYVFNSSPRAFFAAEGKHNERTLVWETGEFLNVFRRPWLAARMRGDERAAMNFMRYNWLNSIKFVAEHNMYGLSRGLLIAAVAHGNPHAREVFAANIPRQEALVADAESCGALFAQVVVSEPVK